jgi:hypothetical protein
MVFITSLKQYNDANKQLINLIILMKLYIKKINKSKTEKHGEKRNS